MNTITASEAGKIATDTQRQAVYDQIRRAAAAGATSTVFMYYIGAELLRELSSAGYELHERNTTGFLSYSEWVISWDKQ